MTKKLESDLNGDVDAFGLDEFGQPVGLNPVWGAAVGTGLGTVSAIATRQFMPRFAEHSELIGFGVAALASGAMVAMPGTRAAGWTGLASAFLNNGLRQLELMFFRQSIAEAAADASLAPSSGDMQGVVVDPTQSLGEVEIDRTESLGAGDMPQLVGASLSAANEHVQLVGGPQLAAHSGAFGATLFGNR